MKFPSNQMIAYSLESSATAHAPFDRARFVDANIGEVVRAGLSREVKELPSYLLYDKRGSALFEAITHTREYFITRRERALFTKHASQIVDANSWEPGEVPFIVELGAGRATKSQILLRQLSVRFGSCVFFPIDVSESALSVARARMRRELPEVKVCPMVTTNEEAMTRLRLFRQRKIVLFLGSSIGNYSEVEGLRLLTHMREGLSPDDVLLLSTDFVKDLTALFPAYDDASGITAAFNKNLLQRINRELSGTFDPNLFRHQVRWNAETQSMEMHLQSIVSQRVRVSGLREPVIFKRGETIRTEFSAKYDMARVDALLARAGLHRESTFTDQKVALHLVRRVRVHD